MSLVGSPNEVILAFPVKTPYWTGWGEPSFVTTYLNHSLAPWPPRFAPTRLLLLPPPPRRDSTTALPTTHIIII